MNQNGFKAVESMLMKISIFLGILILTFTVGAEYPVQFSWFIIFSGFIIFIHKAYKEGSK